MKRITESGKQECKLIAVGKEQRCADQLNYYRVGGKVRML